jgi:hypothetical protein
MTIFSAGTDPLAAAALSADDAISQPSPDVVEQLVVTGTGQD